jgi:hypothetical protein
MRPRTELGLGLGLLVLLLFGAALLGRRANTTPDQDPRVSTFLAGPQGARGLADALIRLGIPVERFRGRLRQLHDAIDADSGGRVLVAFLDPANGIEPREANEIAALSSRADLLLAGMGSAAVMQCYGVRPQYRVRDSMQAVAPGARPGIASPWVRAVLMASTPSEVRDSSLMDDESAAECRVPERMVAETLLVSRTGRLIALRLRDRNDERSVTLVADGALFSNRALRATDAGPFALGLFTTRRGRVVFEEAHQGFGVGGSLGSAVFAWSLRTPWGWAAWQLAGVGLLALLAGAVRFGPPVPMLMRRRRSPLEHVRALATALAAANGHDVAVRAIVRGLGRRLLPAGQRARADGPALIDRITHTVRSSRGRDAARHLQALTKPRQPAESVLAAALAVEDVWEDLRP